MGVHQGVLLRHLGPKAPTAYLEVIRNVGRQISRKVLIVNGRIYGYPRVSSKDQHLDRQREALAGVDVQVEEKASGALNERSF